MVAQTRTVWVPILPLDHGPAIFQDQGNDFGEVGVELVQYRTLAVGAGETGHVADIETGIEAALDDGGAGAHGRHPLRAREVWNRKQAGGMTGADFRRDGRRPPA
jgi:hypothetical protein